MNYRRFVKGRSYNLDLVSSVPWSTNNFGTAAEWATFFGGATIVNFELLDDSDDCQVRMLVIGNSEAEVFLDAKNITDVNIFAVDGVTDLFLRDNQIVDFNPSIALPNSLTNLDLRLNQLSQFNPSIPIPTTITTLALSDNNFTDYSLSEPWANEQPAFTNLCTIVFNGNPVTPIGTTFETILNTKNATLIY